MEVMKKIIKSISLVFIILVAICITAACGFAKGVPNYNPKEQNPKPGLYYAGKTKYFPESATILKDGKVLILTGKNPSSKCVDRIEIFDPSTGKFSDVLKLPYYIALRELSFPLYEPSLLLNDGRVLLWAGVIIKEVTRNAEVYQIYNPTDNSIKVVGTSTMCRAIPHYNGKPYSWYMNTTPNIISQLSNGNVAAYCTRIKGTAKDGKILYRNEMEIIDLKNSTISEPIKKGEYNYITPPEHPKSKLILKDLTPRYKELYPQLKFDEKFSFSFFPVKLTDERYMLISNQEADYGISTGSLNLSRPPSRNSWFSPIYEYNIQTTKLIKKYEYLRSATGRIYHLKDTNKILIIGGEIKDVLPPLNQNSEPSKISLWNRVLYPDWMRKPTKKIYIYVY